MPSIHSFKMHLSVFYEIDGILFQKTFLIFFMLFLSSYQTHQITYMKICIKCIDASYKQSFMIYCMYYSFPICIHHTLILVLFSVICEFCC